MVQVEIKWAHKIPGHEVAEVWGRVRFASAGDRVYSYDIRLKTILDFVALAETDVKALGVARGVFITKYLHDQGGLDNYASLWAWYGSIWPETEIGSVWANFHALGQ